MSTTPQKPPTVLLEGPPSGTSVEASSVLSPTYLRGGHQVKRSFGHGVRKKPPPPPTPAAEETVARLMAAGASKGAVQRSLHLGREAVEKILSYPHVQEFMAQCREATRAITLAGVAHVQAQAMEWLGNTVEQKDSRAFDSVSRGVLALEKTGSSASGEARANVQVAVLNTQQESAEVQALIRALTR